MAYTKESIKTLLTDSSYESLVEIWNEFCDYNSWEDIIYDNDAFGLEMLFGHNANALIDLARGITYGNYHYADDYVVMQGDGNLKSFNGHFIIDNIDIDELVNWLYENPKFINFDVDNDTEESEE